MNKTASLNTIQPNLFIPGAAKSGTTSLHDMLHMHPDVCMSRMKEPVFWNTDSVGIPKKINWYNSLFEQPEASVLGESTTSYMYYPEFIETLQIHYKTPPKFIFILRNPIDRFYSHYWWMVGRQQETRNFDACLKEEPLRSFEAYGLTPNYYYHFGLYHHWLQHFYKAFGKDQILILTLESLKTDPLKTVNQCFEFLNLAPLDTINLQQSNKTGRLKHPKLYHFIKQFTKGRYKITKLAKYLLPERQIEVIKHRLSQHPLIHKTSDFKYPSITEQQRLDLKALYETDVKHLEVLTGINFKQWTDFKTPS